MCFRIYLLFRTDGAKYMFGLIKLKWRADIDIISLSTLFTYYEKSCVMKHQQSRKLLIPKAVVLQCLFIPLPLNRTTIKTLIICYIWDHWNLYSFTLLREIVWKYHFKFHVNWRLLRVSSLMTVCTQLSLNQWLTSRNNPHIASKLSGNIHLLPLQDTVW